MAVGAVQQDHSGEAGPPALLQQLQPPGLPSTTPVSQGVAPQLQISLTVTVWAGSLGAAQGAGRRAEGEHLL